MHNLLTVSPYISQGSDKKIWFNIYELPELVIISIILVTFMFDSGVIL